MQSPSSIVNMQSLENSTLEYAEQIHPFLQKKFEKPLFHILKNMTQKYLFKLYANTYAYRIEFNFTLQYGGNKIAATNV